MGTDLLGEIRDRLLDGNDVIYLRPAAIPLFLGLEPEQRSVPPQDAIKLDRLAAPFDWLVIDLEPKFGRPLDDTLVDPVVAGPRVNKGRCGEG